MKMASGRVGYFVSNHLRTKKTYYLGFAIALFVGIMFGIILHFTSNLGTFVLSSNDQQIFDFVTKDASILQFFFSKLLDLVVAFAIVFVCGLSIYSSFLIFVFFAYQGMVFGAVCCQIISSYGFLGVLNVLVILLPVNLILFVILFFVASICLSRASIAKKYRMGFRQSFYYERGFFKLVGVGVCAGVVFVLLISLLLSVALRAVTFVAY